MLETEGELDQTQLFVNTAAVNINCTADYQFNIFSSSTAFIS